MNRRAFLTATAGVGVVGVAGCIGGDGGGDDGGDDERTADTGTQATDDGDDGDDPADVEELWSTTVDNWKLRSPTVAGGAVYVTGISPGAVYSFDLETGEQRWDAQANANTEGAADVGEGAAYVGTTAGDVHAFDLEDGSERWQIDLGDEASSATAVRDGLVYINDRRNTAFALDAADGEIEWDRSPANVPLDLPANDGTLFLSHDSGSGAVVALDAATGDEEWVNDDVSVESAPAFGAGSVFVGEWPSEVAALNADDGTREWSAELDLNPAALTVVDDRAIVAEEESDDESVVRALDVDDGDEVWSTTVSGEANGPPAHRDGVLYHGFTDGVVRGIDADTGDVLVAHQLDGWVRAPTLADDTLIATTNEGTVYALGLD